MLADHVAGGVIGSLKPELLLGEAMPTGIANAFFGMCRLEGDFDENEARVESLLRKAVKDEIEMRNDVAHGDWEVGSFYAEPPYAVLDPVLIRIRPGRVGTPREPRSLSVRDIDKLSNRVLGLLTHVDEFGRLALRMPVLLATPRDDDTSVSTGDYRVRDVYEARQETRGGKRKITRDGPRAREVYQRDYDTPYTPFWDVDLPVADDSAAS